MSRSRFSSRFSWLAAGVTLALLALLPAGWAARGDEPTYATVASVPNSPTPWVILFVGVMGVFSLIWLRRHRRWHA